MNSIKLNIERVSFLWPNTKELVSSVNSSKHFILGVVCISGGVLGAYFIKKMFDFKKNTALREKWNSAGKDVVVLHQFWMGKFCPNLSPYVIKVESFLRLSGIEYVRDFQKPFGPNKLCPWITINGEDFTDSQVIVEHLAEYFETNLDAQLTPERNAALEAARIMLEEQIFWIIYLHRYYFEKSKIFVTTQEFPKKYLKYFFMYVMPNLAYRRAKNQGILSFSEARHIELCRKALGYLDALLGDASYFGGTEPCTVDCCIFGFLMQFKWNAPGTFTQKLVTEEYPRLDKYCLTMKEKIYPDWNEILNPPFEKKEFLPPTD